MMLDWNGYLKQITSTIGQLASVSPDIVRGYRTLSDAGQKTGKLDAKTREWIALGVAVTRQCNGRITVHTEAAIKAGATEEELVEALGVAVVGQRGRAARLFGSYARRVQRQDRPRAKAHEDWRKRAGIEPCGASVSIQPVRPIRSRSSGTLDLDRAAENAISGRRFLPLPAVHQVRVEGSGPGLSAPGADSSRLELGVPSAQGSASRPRPHRGDAGLDTLWA